MVDLKRLNEKIEDSGMTLKSIAKKADIPYQTLWRKVNGIGEFKASDIVKVSKVLRLKASERNDIFLQE